MEYLVGIVLALVVAVFARVTGPGSSRRAWPRTACSTCFTAWWWSIPACRRGGRGSV